MPTFARNAVSLEALVATHDRAHAAALASYDRADHVIDLINSRGTLAPGRREEIEGRIIGRAGDAWYAAEDAVIRALGINGWAVLPDGRLVLAHYQDTGSRQLEDGVLVILPAPGPRVPQPAAV